MTEQDIITQYFTRHRLSSDKEIGVGDDAAVVVPPNNSRLVITTDTLNMGVHFDSNWLPDCIGYKSLAVSLSDLAAMGAQPLWATISLSIPDIDHQWLRKFSDELFSLADRYNIKVIGGDLVKGPVSITVQAIGFVKENALTRSSAKTGDLIFVTGQIGDAALGLKLHNSISNISVSPNDDAFFRSRLYKPEPRIRVGKQIVSLANAAIDISDGLLIDLQRILTQSNVGAVIDIGDVPVSNALKHREKYLENWETIILGGEDYELIFTANKKDIENIIEISKKTECPITHIGNIVSNAGVELCYEGNLLSIPKNQGFDHFN